MPACASQASSRLVRREQLWMCLATAILIGWSSIAAAQSLGDGRRGDPARASGETSSSDGMSPSEGTSESPHAQPTARDFESPHRPDLTPGAAEGVDEIYHQLTGQDFAPKDDRQAQSPNRRPP
jgi:hypothetical protein